MAKCRLLNEVEVGNSCVGACVLSAVCVCVCVCVCCALCVHVLCVVFCKLYVVCHDTVCCVGACVDA